MKRIANVAFVVMMAACVVEGEVEGLDGDLEASGEYAELETDEEPTTEPGARHRYQYTEAERQLTVALEGQDSIFDKLGLKDDRPVTALKCGSAACTHGCHHSDWCSAGSTICYVHMDINNQPTGEGGCTGCGGTYPNGQPQPSCSP